MNMFDLDTPCLMLDLDILEENLEKMQANVNAAGKNLRPHAKSHKCSTLAKRQLEKGTTALPPLGTVLELIVSHCDPTVNQFDCFHLIRKGEVVDEWPIDLRGKSQ